MPPGAAGLLVIGAGAGGGSGALDPEPIVPCSKSAKFSPPNRPAVAAGAAGGAAAKDDEDGGEKGFSLFSKMVSSCARRTGAGPGACPGTLTLMLKIEDYFIL